METKLRMIVVDDHPLMRDGIVCTLRDSAGLIEVLGACGDADSAVALARDTSPDLALVDISIPGGGLEAVGRIIADQPSVKCVMLTVSERPAHVSTAFAAGAKGYILKGINGEELLRAVLSVAAGNTYVSPELAGKILNPTGPSKAEHTASEAKLQLLTARELEVVKLLNHGQTNKDIATQLAITEKTVKYYLTTIFQKLGVRSRLEAVIFYRGVTGNFDGISRH